MKKLTYSNSGVNYSSLDPVKKLAQKAALQTAKNLKKSGFPEIVDSRGETAFVWQQKKYFMATITESLGTKNLVADAMRAITGKTYYDVMGHDTVASAVNDLACVGAKPLDVHAFWAVGNSDWFHDKKRVSDLISGWEKACNLSGASWGGGETPSLNNIVEKYTIALGASVVGIITNKKRLLTDKNLKSGDRIILINSNGINANGISLTRAIAKKLPKGYKTKLPNGTLYGEAILTKTNIYAKLIQDLLDSGINIHYISNITGHGLRKVMRARQNFSYIIEKLFDPQEIFTFIQEKAQLSDEEMYGTFNMGNDYALFLPEKDVLKALKIITKNKFKGVHAGYIEEGEKRVVIQSKNIIFDNSSLDLR